jgi:hypothetical protein
MHKDAPSWHSACGFQPPQLANSVSGPTSNSFPDLYFSREDLIMLNNIRLCQGAAIVSLVLASSAAVAQEACVSLDTALTVVRAQEYAPLISQAAEGSTPEQVEFISFMESGSWSAVYAATPVDEPGYFFL